MLAGLPFAFTAGSQFLGRDVSSLAAGVMGFYPWVAAYEAFKVLGAAFCVMAVVVAFTVTAQRKVAGDRVWARWLFAAAPVVAYGAWLGAAVLHYPSLFEEALPAWAKIWVFRGAFHVSPQTLYRVATVLVGVAPVALAARLVIPRGGATAVAPRYKQALFKAGLCAASATLAAVTWKAMPNGRSHGAAVKPHVLVIGVDSLRVDRLGNAAVTPHLTALMNDPQTVSFTEHYVGVPRTFPSWIEMIEGRYAAKTGIRHMFPDFASREGEKQGLVTAFRDAGYRTIAVSDFAGDIFPRFQAGFQTVDAPKLTLKTMIRMMIDRAFPLLTPLVASDLGQVLFPALRESPAYADAGWLARRALDDFGDSKAPTFLTLFFSTAHFPYAAPFPHYKAFASADYDGAYLFEKNPEAGLREGAQRDADVAQVRALYDGAVHAVDAEVGRIERELKMRGLWDDTIVVVTADHGEDLYEDGVGQGHGEHLRGRNVLRVPFLVKMPAGARPSVNKIEFMTRSIDVASTVTAAAGVGGGKIGDGENFLPWVRGERAGDPGLSAYSETEIWFERTGDGFFQKKRLDYPGISGLLDFDQGYSGEIVLNPGYEEALVTAKHRMIADARYKLIYMPTPDGIEYELYDRKADPDDKVNLAAEQPAALEEMRGRLMAWIGMHEAKRRVVSGYVVPR